MTLEHFDVHYMFGYIELCLSLFINTHTVEKILKFIYSANCKYVSENKVSNFEIIEIFQIRKIPKNKRKIFNIGHLILNNLICSQILNNLINNLIWAHQVTYAVVSMRLKETAIEYC